jgi:hypothetical protein
MDLADLPDDFDWKYYCTKNTDLWNAGIRDEKKAIRHWLKMGKKEKREYTKKLNIYDTSEYRHKNFFVYIDVKDIAVIKTDKIIKSIKTFDMSDINLNIIVNFCFVVNEYKTFLQNSMINGTITFSHDNENTNAMRFINQVKKNHDEKLYHDIYVNIYFDNNAVFPYGIVGNNDMMINNWLIMNDMKTSMIAHSKYIVYKNIEKYDDDEHEKLNKIIKLLYSSDNSQNYMYSMSNNYWLKHEIICELIDKYDMIMNNIDVIDDRLLLRLYGYILHMKKKVISEIYCDTLMENGIDICGNNLVISKRVMKKKKIVMIAHENSYTGGNIFLLSLRKYLYQKNYVTEI